MKVGFVLPQTGSDGDGGTWPGVAALARQAEDGGADSLWLCDHFLFRGADGSEAGYHEPWTLLSALAAVTTRVALGTLVLATSFRPPGLLAKMASTANEIAPGRLILGLGCGWHEPEYRAFGYPFDHRVGRFEEALRAIVPLLHGERVSFDARWSRLEDAVVLPPPRAPSPTVMIAAHGERMQRLTARFADSWQTAWYGPPDGHFTARRTQLLAACAAEGRDAATLEVTAGVMVARPGESVPPGGRRLPADPAAIADGLAAWAEAGAGHIQLGISPKTPRSFDLHLDGIHRFRSRSRSEPPPE
jgi:alkanesulfonate monooxygenase SsuD/methylene tetrahydromethanopterin reductase-like flavin-dependent oxidoreductase (luciferase family)